VGSNFGTWVTRIQLREYSLHATKWVRLASGLQSLISVLLVALAILIKDIFQTGQESSSLVRS
jgi:hypothetical protein